VLQGCPLSLLFIILSLPGVTVDLNGFNLLKVGLLKIEFQCMGEPKTGKATFYLEN